ncbi:cation:proton antiporter [Halopiger aswanensis]|uniref:Sodium/proton antiporter (CPA1 family) n=1 Tax=Halopiger aswanensis TaxID=148449 RepID=A0A3R7GVN8_9EURY|nr:cation:proton antiporter [Halopiger aswanensis]RKD95079.1 sodium/proton antiporter (CPA1 family) [Halopiger aswanensis]
MALELFQLYNLVLIFVGIAILGIAILPRFISNVPVTDPIFYIVYGFILFSLPLGIPEPDPLAQGHTAERLTELGVIIALMTVGLKLDRPPGLRSWESVWRLLGITMPVTIGLSALVGWWAGFAIPTAVLLGAVIAPTDPVVASEVQVEGPGGSSEEQPKPEADGRQDEVRFALSGESGLNDGFAFPFTNLAVAMALVGVAPGNWVGEWLLIDVVYRIVVGVVVALVLGWLLARLVFIAPVSEPLPKAMLGLEALGGTLAVYGIVEVLGGYGFIGVFVAATVLRDYERRHVFYEPLHDLSEKAEQLLQVAIMTLFGGAIAGGLLEPLTLELFLAAVAIVFLVRPVAGIVALLGFDRSWSERLAISVYGLRGIGTFYYLAYALNQAPFAGAERLWAVAATSILLSAVVLGISATPVIEKRLGEEPGLEETIGEDLG